MRNNRLLLLILLNIILGLVTAVLFIDTSLAFLTLLLLIVLPMLETLILVPSFKTGTRPSLFVLLLIILFVFIISSLIFFILITIPNSPSIYSVNMESFIPRIPSSTMQIVGFLFLEVVYSIYYFIASIITNIIYKKLKLSSTQISSLPAA
jgi:hypothetical protein